MCVCVCQEGRKRMWRTKRIEPTDDRFMKRRGDVALKKIVKSDHIEVVSVTSEDLANLERAVTRTRERTAESHELTCVRSQYRTPKTLIFLLLLLLIGILVVIALCVIIVIREDSSSSSVFIDIVNENSVNVSKLNTDKTMLSTNVSLTTAEMKSVSPSLTSKAKTYLFTSINSEIPIQKIDIYSNYTTKTLNSSKLLTLASTKPGRNREEATNVLTTSGSHSVLNSLLTSINHYLNTSSYHHHHDHNLSNTIVNQAVSTKISYPLTSPSQTSRITNTLNVIVNGTESSYANKTAFTPTTHNSVATSMLYNITSSSDVNMFNNSKTNFTMTSWAVLNFSQPTMARKTAYVQVLTNKITSIHNNMSQSTGNSTHHNKNITVFKPYYTQTIKVLLSNPLIVSVNSTKTSPFTSNRPKTTSNVLLTTRDTFKSKFYSIAMLLNETANPFSASRGEIITKDVEFSSLPDERFTSNQKQSTQTAIGNISTMISQANTSITNVQHTKEALTLSNGHFSNTLKTMTSLGHTSAALNVTSSPLDLRSNFSKTNIVANSPSYEQTENSAANVYFPSKLSNESAVFYRSNNFINSTVLSFEFQPFSSTSNFTTSKLNSSNKEGKNLFFNFIMLIILSSRHKKSFENIILL